MKAAVIGAGSWGTAIAQVLGSKGMDVCLWARRDDVVDGINRDHHNPRYLSDSPLADTVSATSSYPAVLEGADAVVVVTPSYLVRDVGSRLSGLIGDDTPVIICSKGIEEGTGDLPIAQMEQEIGNEGRIAVLSGPNHAEEVIRALPAATVIAGSDEQTVTFFRDLFATEQFRTYTSHDPVGVQLCSAFKNVIAIAVGIGYGLGFGDNTAASLVTRGLAEMSRMVVKCGGDPLTCMGLAGTGDMIVTCMSRLSRNRRFGEEYVSQGKTMDDFTTETHMVVEGALACRTLEVLKHRYEVDLPITDTVRQVVWGDLDVREAAYLLSTRPLKTEIYGL